MDKVKSCLMWSLWAVGVSVFVVSALLMLLCGALAYCGKFLFEVVEESQDREIFGGMDIF